MVVGTNLEGKLLEGIGETGERLVAGTGLGHESQSASRAGNLTVGNLYAGGLGDVILEGRVGSRGHGPTTGGERTRRISAEGRPRQHCVPRTEEEKGKQARTQKGLKEGGN